MSSRTRTHSPASAGPTRPDGTALRVLAVDDEPAVRELLSMALRYEGWDVQTAATGYEAVRLAGERRPDAVVLDRMLPDMDGLEVLRRLRAGSPNVPVVFLTARDSLPDRLGGLTAGADDYVTKPFRLDELDARLRSLLRRTCPAPTDGSLLAVGDLTLDENSREVSRGGEPIRLSAKEFDLLRYLMRNPRRVLTKAQILDRVWGHGPSGSYNSVELYISYLRRKIHNGREPMIHTLRGVGYMLKPPAGDRPDVSERRAIAGEAPWHPETAGGPRVSDDENAFSPREGTDRRWKR